MTNKQKIFGLVAIAILLWYLSRKKLPIGSSTVRMLDSITGLPLMDGASTDSNTIGEVLLPPGIPNDVSSASFQHAVQNPEDPICPEGFTPVIDPSTNKAYCTLSA
jgi:hypothetical protein